MGGDGHHVPDVGMEPFLYLLGSRFRNPGPAIGFIESADILAWVDFGLKSGHAARAFFLDPEIETAVAFQGAILQADAKIRENLVGDEMAEFLFGGGMSAVNNTILDFPLPFANRMPTFQRLSVPDGTPFVAAKVLNANVAKTDLDVLAG